VQYYAVDNDERGSAGDITLDDADEQPATGPSLPVPQVRIPSMFVVTERNVDTVVAQWTPRTRQKAAEALNSDKY
jgi:hypothetical protein